ncbi:helix-turn-helix domain-containing protein [Flavobacterium macacae]|uniref:Helix-turn-helix domain-containing protein n=1 Tax=Flavobacterium macacae TaxID=2488993 RepID=A0A3P3W740_9FLAO|nr:helix-turn-helix domain-containing protein [Flavobacterium macacae]RRJ90780.1 helix-turn-helix domain-containing protein [Flavobacterium macacae]
MIYQGRQNEYFEIQTVDDKTYRSYRPIVSGALQLLWFLSDGNRITIDGISHNFDANQIISLSQHHQVQYEAISSMKMLRFNAEFYCVLNHDSEVGCKGILYYTPAKIPVVRIEGNDLAVMNDAWDVTDMELEMKDSLQLEMLQMQLKRVLILCTRIYKKQDNMACIDDSQHDLVREFNFLVEKHFREFHGVAHYAALLHKSPKTITNTFNKIGEKSPLQVIHNRILLESKRLLHYTKRDISEIAYELNFENVQGFSRFFKKQTGISPSDFRISLEK